MGDAADDAFDAAMEDERLYAWQITACPCAIPNWEVDEDGLFVCQNCGVSVDI